jgi:hypothetical protein
MGLLDKVKAQASAATAVAKDAAQKGQAKLDEVQSKKGADGMLRDLGAAFYATKTGRATPSTDSDIERLVGALQAHEADSGANVRVPHVGPRVCCGGADRHRVHDHHVVRISPDRSDTGEPASANGLPRQRPAPYGTDHLAAGLWCGSPRPV